LYVRVFSTTKFELFLSEMGRRTALGFNPQHKLHVNTINVDHPEHPNRIDEIQKRLELVGLIKECQVLTVN
jgi:hypothetical protein